jgi:predicted Zn-dependent protease
MHFQRFFAGLFMVALGRGLGLGAEPPQPAGQTPAAEVEKMLDRVFGKATEEDEKALAKIDISVQEERQMGQQVAAAFLARLKGRQIAVVSRGKDVQYLYDLVKTVRPMLAHGDRYPTITIYLAESADCDARSLPGGTLVFFRGLLDMAHSEAALIGIVGHELSHLDRGHLLARARRVKLAEQRLSEASKQFSLQRFMEASTAMTNVWMRPFRSEDEAQADRDGAGWAYQAGYDPREMAKLFRALGQRQKNRLPLPDFLQSHPAPENRYEAIMKLYDDLQQAAPKDRLYLGKENLRRRLAKSRRMFPE